MFEFKPGHFKWYEEIISFFLISLVCLFLMSFESLINITLSYFGL